MGKRGATVQKIESESGARIATPRPGTIGWEAADGSVVTVTGDFDAIHRAVLQIVGILEQEKAARTDDGD